jgi:predicted flap endonuclease-1-like 5' DNA nuclease
MFDFEKLTVIPSILIGAFFAWLLSALFDSRKKQGVQVYESTAEDSITINKLKGDLAAATENADKVAEVHAYARQLEAKVQTLEAASGAAGGPDSELRVKVLEQQLAEKADLEGKLAVAMQQLNDYRAKAEMFDSVVGGSVAPVAETVVTEPVVETATVVTPTAQPVAEPVIEKAPSIEVIENPTAPATEPIHTNGSSAHAVQPEPAQAPTLRVETPNAEPKIAEPKTPEPIVAEAEPAATAVAYSGSKDALEKIDGIGQVYQQKLYEAGIFTFAQLAAASPSRITEIIEPQNWQHIDVMKWRREAALFAAGEKL